MSSRSKKRPRNDEKAAGVIEIRGVPANVTPLLIQAIRSATQFFQLIDSSTYTVQEEENNESSTPRRGGAVMNDVLTRMQQENDTAHKAKEEKRQKRRERTELDLKVLMEAIRQHVRGGTGDKKVFQVDVACFVYAFNVCREHDRMAVRRASQLVCGRLLSKSRACRAHVVQDQRLLDWMKSVTNVSEAQQETTTTANNNHLSKLQSEAWMWMRLLSQEYGHFYPQFNVASLYIQQQCPNVLVSMEQQQQEQETSTIGTNNIVELRRLRDLALQHAEEECQAVERLVQRAERGLEVLVPRIGEETVQDDNVVDDENDDDESDVDWEDGDDQDIEFESEFHHQQAVERTLAVMEQSGGILQSGALEVNFDDTQQHADSSSAAGVDSSEIPNKEQVTESLRKCVRRLSLKHLPRLSKWIQALVKADNLYQSEEKSWIMLPSTISRQRGQVLESLMNAKKKVATILALASKLNVQAPPDTATQANNYSNRGIVRRRQEASSPYRGSRGRILQVATTQRPSQNSSRQRSNRVQIKYRK